MLLMLLILISGASMLELLRLREFSLSSSACLVIGGDAADEDGDELGFDNDSRIRLLGGLVGGDVVKNGGEVGGV